MRQAIFWNHMPCIVPCTDQTLLVKYHAAILFLFEHGTLKDLNYWLTPIIQIYRSSPREQLSHFDRKT
ncbi:hypothetical protein LMH87_001122 [Akanthomyces muscarius]|uniref:Uncharacterized protein n=1 Tax=Akanthomyces muscarius TaxID=2231603 RepID=A0A9W8UPE1_AKAMU|nr:hypothetical protein LMH87_001122 [Akanthomyces muscarius]KAJ4155899.1 hypothetical protein LMH87_001122 [Akanthomyces muscarius]